MRVVQLIASGKTTFFVYNQAKIDALPGDAIAGLKTELSTVEEESKLLGSEAKSLSTGTSDDCSAHPGTHTFAFRTG